MKGIDFVNSEGKELRINNEELNNEQLIILVVSLLFILNYSFFIQNPMSKVLIAGGTGLVGTRLSQLLNEKGYEVVHLSRKKDTSAKYLTYQWDTTKGSIEAGAFEGVTHIINMAGAGIADRLWTKARKKLLIESRTQTTALLAKYIAQLAQKPKVYVSAAAIGIYGDRGDETLTESSEIGKDGFMVKCCEEWEQAIQALANKTNVRTVTLRIGIVLSTKGGALPKMLLPLKFFTASYFGDGQQWYSWVHIDDVCNMFIKAMETDTMEGIYNATTPNPLTNKDLTKRMVKALGKRALVIPAPTATLRIGMGEMADVVLNSNKVLPQRLQKLGFSFQFPTFEEAVKDVVGNGK